MKNKKLTVIILAYKSERTISDCLKSVSSQTVPLSDYEILIVYRDSNDQTKKMINKYPYIKIIEQPANQPGIAVARNIGIKSSKTDLIAFTDADCIVPENWVENIIKTFTANSKIIAIGGPLIPFKSKFPGYIEKYGGIIAEIFGNVGKLATNNSAYRRNIFKKTGLFDTKLPTGEDVDMSWKIEKIPGLIKILPDLIVKHLPRHTLNSFFMEQFNYGFGRSLLINIYPDKYSLIEKNINLVLLSLFIITTFTFYIFLFKSQLIGLIGLILIVIFFQTFSVFKRLKIFLATSKKYNLLTAFFCIPVYWIIDIANILGIIKQKLVVIKSQF